MNQIVLRTSDTIPEEELPPEFLQGMVNRRMQGYRKYGTAKNNAVAYDRVSNLKERLSLYEETGNTEWLMDVAVFAWLEFNNPRHADAHFRATGDDESPGALKYDGTRTHGEAAREEAARQAYGDREGD